MSLKPFTLLLVDDNPADVKLMEDTICRWETPCEIHTVGDGESALNFLYQSKGRQHAPRPHLIFLDLGTPKLDGFDLLRTVKEDSALRAIPIVVFAGDRAPAQVQQAYDLRANAYVAKPMNLDEYLQVLNATGEYWLKIVSLPHKGIGPS